MPLYQYNSLNRQGKKIAGSIDAPTIQAAREMLRGQGLMPINITDANASGAGFSFAQFFEKKVEVKTVVLFTKQLSVLLRSSIPLLQAFELLIEQFDGRFQRILIGIKEGLQSGESLTGLLQRHPKVFSNVYIQLVKAGEASGKLDLILERLTSYLEKTAETKKRIKKAMSYPIMMLSFIGVVVVALLTLMVPRLRGMFDQMGEKLPAPTQLLLTMSDLVRNNFFMLVIGAIIMGILFKRWKATPSGAYKFDEILLKLPMTSYFSRTNAVVQFSKTLGMLLESGVNLAEALDIVCNIVENKVLVKKLNEARDKIIKAGKISQYLKETGMFPNIASYMISTGEESGQLAQMLLTVGNDYEVMLQDLTEGLTAKITPIMTIVMAAVIGFIVLAIFLPIMSMGDMSGM